MAAIAILTVACTAGVLFLLRFLVAICGEHGRGNHVVHVLQVQPKHDGCGSNQAGTDPKSSMKEVSQFVAHRRMVPVSDLNVTGLHRGGTRRSAAVQKTKTLDKSSRSKAGKSLR